VYRQRGDDNSPTNFRHESMNLSKTSNLNYYFRYV